MSLLTPLRRKKPQDVAPASQAPCSHWELAPRWDSVADMGHADLVTYYACVQCGERVSREEAASRSS